MKGILLPPPLHGSQGPFTREEDHEKARVGARRARELLQDEELGRLLTAPRERREIERARQVFVNRNLRMSKVEVVGFDMDYTLAIYHMRRIEQLSYDLTLA
jgi:5'-nucleotidase